MTPTTTLQVFFVVVAGQDDQGLLFATEASKVKPGIVLDRLVSYGLRDFPGGFALVVNGQVWNSLIKAPFRADRVHCDVEGIGAAYMVVRDFVMQLVDGRPFDGRPIECLHSDMLSMVFAAGSDPDLWKMEGTVSADEVLYPEVMVPWRDLLLGLHRATGDCLRLAERLEKKLAAPATANQERLYPKIRASLATAYWTSIEPQLGAAVSAAIARRS